MQKICEAHFHAAGERRRHGVDAGNEFGKKQSLLAAAVKIFRRAQNAGFGIGREPAEQTQQGPSAGSACEIKNDIPGDHGRYTDSEDEVEMQVSIGRDGARGQDGERGGQRKADGLGEANYRQEQVAVMRNR